MGPSPLNQLLLDQISQALGDNPDLHKPGIRALLRRISDTYEQNSEELEKAKAEAELRTKQLMASTSNAYSFLDSLHMGLIMCDINGEVVLTNKSAQTLLSSTIELKPEQSWNIDFVNSLFQSDIKLKKLVLEVIASVKTIECKAVNYGKYVINLSLAPLVNEIGSGKKQTIGVVILIEDITQQTMLDRSKDEFFSIASHELRTPLTAIRGNTSLIKKYYADNIANKDMAEMVDDIHDSSVRLIGIVNDFLDAAALEQGKLSLSPEPFAVGEVIIAVAREMNSLCEAKGIQMRVGQDLMNLPPVMADSQRIKQVIINLVGNAIKFTSQGSITINARTAGQTIETIVTDTGKGMSPENQRLLFHKFQQASDSILTRDTTKGTGLGLYISKLIVDQSGGKMWLKRSEPDVGTTFAFSLPRAS